jgi:abortive infection bacteriophage resistance protein
LEIIQKANSYNFTSNLADKHVTDEEFSVWNLVELLSFGKFVELYTMYYQEYTSPNYSDYLQSIKFLRNALAKAKKEISEHARVKYMAYPVFHDFVALLFVYNDILKESANRTMRNRTMNELRISFAKKMDES